MNDIEDGFDTSASGGKGDRSSHFSVKVRSKLPNINKRFGEKSYVESDPTAKVTTNGYASKCSENGGGLLKESGGDERFDCCGSGNCCQIETASIWNLKGSERIGEAIGNF